MADPPPDIRVVAPFLRADHGHVFCVEHRDGRPVVTADGHAILVMRGMLHGTLEEMTRQADYAVARVDEQNRAAIAVIEANHPSFRYPDALLRALLRSIRTHEHKVHRLYFAGLSRIVRVGFRMFALPLMSADMRSKLCIVKTADLLPMLGHNASLYTWGGGVDFDVDSYIARRAQLEGVAPPASNELRIFDAELLKSANKALREEARRRSDTFSTGDIVFRADCEKRGSGGLFGSVAWKPKTIAVSDAALAYASHEADFGNDATVVDREEIRDVTVEGRTVCVRATKREFLLRFASADAASRCVRVLGRARDVTGTGGSCGKDGNCAEDADRRLKSE